MNLPKIYKYSVFTPGKIFESNNIDLITKKACLFADGTYYVNIRFEAEKRLQRRYFRLFEAGRLPVEIDYPNLIKTEK